MTAAHAESVSVFHFCADDFAKRERLSAWQELLGRKVLGMETEPLPSRPFHFDMKLYALSGLSLMVGRGSGIYLHRTKKLINNDNFSFAFAIGCSDPWCLSQFGREATADAGDAIAMSHGAVATSSVPQSGRRRVHRAGGRHRAARSQPPRRRGVAHPGDIARPAIAGEVP
jgi:hypothetical protein